MVGKFWIPVETLLWDNRFFVKSEWIPTQKDTSTSPFRGQSMCFYLAYFATRPFLRLGA